MHHIAEFGVAAHYSYKEGATPEAEIAEKLGGIAETTSEGLLAASDPHEVMDLLRMSFYQDEVFVFTPKGDLIKLPKGSTPIDFAYAVHTDLGNHIVGAKVNGRVVQLRHELRNGDAVQVITSPSAQPSNDWLAIVRSPKAKTKIRQLIRARIREDSVALGRELLDKLLRKERRKLPKLGDLEDPAQALGYSSAESLLAGIGSGDISPRLVANKLYSEPPAGKIRQGLDRIREISPFRPGRGIRFDSMDNLMFRIARCCSPIPGEPVVGVITRGRGISVHRRDCPNAFEERVGVDRRVEIEWDVQGYPSFLARLVVYGAERQSFLADLANAISSTRTNIRRADIESFGSDARGVFVVEVQNVRHLQRVIRALEKVRGVREVIREQLPTDSDLDGERKWAG
jgi:GTP pyrophosphokinase